MGTKDARVDAYIAKSPEFAKPILTQLRALVHETLPDVEETVKWRFPYFMHHGMLCGLAAFKKHCWFVFWKDKLVLEGQKPLDAITSVDDLPPKKTLVALVKKAAKLNEAGVALPRAKPSTKTIVVPKDFASALKKNAKARAAFEKFPPGHKREYVEWITGAKKDETRTRRLAQAIDQIAQGKPQSWKYMR